MVGGVGGAGGRGAVIRRGRRGMRVVRRSDWGLPYGRNHLDARVASLEKGWELEMRIRELKEETIHSK